MKLAKNKLLTGTLILTTASLLTRVIGFFYRVFLSHNFGEEGMGVFQLTSPALSLSYALAVSGVQTAISKFVANRKKEDRFGRLQVFFSGLLISLLLSTLISILLYIFSDFVAGTLLSEARCGSLLRVISVSMPFGCIHSCINGYFIGQKKTAIPAGSQLVEQLFRVGSVFLICNLFTSSGQKPSLVLSAVGLLIGEIVSTVFTLLFLSGEIIPLKNTLSMPYFVTRQQIQNILGMAVPLSLNRIIVNLLSSVETVLLPIRLQSYGLTGHMSLSLYGVFTGMALPLILFPCALTNSLTIVLLPTVSQAQADNKNDRIASLVQKSFYFCFLMGIVAMLSFAIFGKQLGTLMFHSLMAGTFIRSLSLLCPLLYITSTLNGIINGLGKTKATLFIQILSVMIRLLFVLFAVPIWGINGYLSGLILSQFISCLLSMLVLKEYFSLPRKLF